MTGTRSRKPSKSETAKAKNGGSNEHQTNPTKAREPVARPTPAQEFYLRAEELAEWWNSQEGMETVLRGLHLQMLLAYRKMKGS